MTMYQDMAYGNTEAEYREICDFLDALSRQDPFMHWESGRMNFWRHNVHGSKSPEDRFFRDNVRLWRDAAGRIIGLCISEYGENDLFVEVSPSHRDVFPEVFRWIDGVWAVDRTAVEIDVFCGDEEKTRRLREQGYSFLCHFENKRTYNLDELDLRYALEDGFAIRTLSETADVTGRVALVRSAFENPGYSAKNVEGMTASPDYVPDFDLMVVSPDGRPVSYCVGWRERAEADRGYVEPVGTHADYRRRGFARAVILECFARMKDQGISTVEIASRAEPAVANYLYESLSPSTKREVHKYAKQRSSAS